MAVALSLRSDESGGAGGDGSMSMFEYVDATRRAGCSTWARAGASRTSSLALTTTASSVTVKRCKTWVELELASSLRRVVPFEVSYW